MQPFGMPGHRTLGDILSDRKVPPRHRRRALVVEDQRRIIWLVGITTSESTRVQAGTARVVRISTEELPHKTIPTGMGIEFCNMSDATEQKLEQLLAQLRPS